MAWSTIRTLYAIPAQDLTVILGSGGTPNVGIQSGRGIAVQVDATTGDLLLHVTIDSGTTWAASSMRPSVIADPGAVALAISVLNSGSCAITTAGAEGRTIAAPTFIGQRISLVHDVAGGSVAITAAGALNQTGHTIMTMAAVGAFAELGAVQIGGGMIWRILSNDGVVLS